MATRPMQNMDRAAIRYIKDKLEEQVRGTRWLSDKSGIPYFTLNTYLKRGDRPLTLGDIDRVLRALGADPSKAVKEIRRIALTMEKADE